MVSSVQVERRWLAGLLANKKTVALLLRFLKAARSREREEVKMEGVRMGAEKTLLEIESTNGNGAPSGSIKYLQGFGPEERNQSSVVHHA